MERQLVENLTAAVDRLRGVVHRTPVVRSSRMDAELGCSLFFKCENLQHTGSFKYRGASNAVRSLDASTGAVATHSSGNHGAALAEAATKAGIDAHIVVPRGAVPAKVTAIRSYGGQVTECEPTHAAREAGLAEVVARTGAEVVHPYNDFRIIAGQGTAALELLDEVPDLDVIVAPVGGGGLISGCISAAIARGSSVRVIGAEPMDADDAARSLADGKRIAEFTPRTIADGLRAHVGEINFSIIAGHIDRIVTVSEEAILTDMRELWHTLKLIVEPSSSTVLSAVRRIQEDLAGKRVGLILSGGNVNLDAIAFCGRCGG